MWRKCLNQISEELDSLDDEQFLKVKLVAIVFRTDKKFVYEQIFIYLSSDGQIAIIPGETSKIGLKKELKAQFMKMKEKAEQYEFCQVENFKIEELFEKDKDSYCMLKFQIDEIFNKYTFVK